MPESSPHLHGFELIEARDIPEMKSHASLYRHIKTGAQLLSVVNDDENKVFGINFYTPIEDATGLPHIMEHAVLCGSRKYPLKEPFVELIKGSLNTFVNAMTYQDRTCYPVASQNVHDLYNLIDVYMDAVFYPLITPQTLQQEGWHYEVETADAPLAYKGVVFNEMKGGYSSKDDLLGQWSQESIYPDTIYGVDSGGDPKAIPDLTYAKFKQFHETYYHPSNAMIFFWGDDDPQERLRYINSWLENFDAAPVQRPHVQVEPFPEPRRLVFEFPTSAQEGEGEQPNQDMLTVNWLLPYTAQVEDELGFEILDYILVGTPASPLRTALIESGLGEDVTGGLRTDLKPSMFSTGLKGIAPTTGEQVESLVLNTLQAIVEHGIDPDMIEAAINTTEFRLRELNTGHFPRGLAVMLGAIPRWMYDDDVLDALAFEAPLSTIKARLASGERYFENLIKTHLLDNVHRTTVLLRPDQELSAKWEAMESDRLATVRETLHADQINELISVTEQLKKAQETPDAPEALATIPSLTLQDMEREVRRYPIEIMQLADTQVLYHDLSTNGLLYLDVGMNLHFLPQQYLPYVPLLSRALLEMGTASEDYVKLTQHIGRKTGGIHTATHISPVVGQTEATAWLFLRGKGTIAQTEELLHILRDVLLTATFDDRERFRQIVLEEKANAEAYLVPAGHVVSMERVSAPFHEAYWADEQQGGVTYLFFLRKLLATIEQNWAAVLNDLEAVRAILINRRAMLVNITTDAESWGIVQPQLTAFLNALPNREAGYQAWQPDRDYTNEGLTIPSQVNYVAKAGNLIEAGYTPHGSFMPILKYLNTTYMWERVRVQGGAYGGFSRFQPVSGLFLFGSYRDPNLLKTLENYDHAADFLRNLEISNEELARSIIGTIGDMDAHLLPDAKGYTSMVYYLNNMSDALRQQRRNEVMETTMHHFHEFGEVLATLRATGRVVVLGPADRINEANTAFDNQWRVTRVL